ncbi:hypothetical protein H8N03_02700 [Ramlibacter sp. USB13]|uniref:DUF2489 domain-containing protein n=1 Tax=Ramlibacter cellulosilyticus TaxID=2764187 RepID=A0A923MM04_9BURK|nr:hypothetical protein [Ramlibacter cellulosilyticus]MBC5781835.1 hypothetical protein [Ramlibacter cellulosilyticus]
MVMTTYLAAWLLLAVAGVAVLSWFLARHRRRHDLRRDQAEQLLQALNRYSEWVCAQRLAAVFQGEGPEAAAALDTACTIRLAWFPELAGDMAELLAVHNRLINFLGTQQALWLRDPEHWLESEHDKRFMALWRQHRYALQALLDKLETAASVRITPAAAPRRHTTYA